MSIRTIRAIRKIAAGMPSRPTPNMPSGPTPPMPQRSTKLIDDPSMYQSVGNHMPPRPPRPMPPRPSGPELATSPYSKPMSQPVQQSNMPNGPTPSMPQRSTIPMPQPPPKPMPQTTQAQPEQDTGYRAGSEVAPPPSQNSMHQPAKNAVPSSVLSSAVRSLFHDVAGGALPYLLRRRR